LAAWRIGHGIPGVQSSTAPNPAFCYAQSRSYLDDFWRGLLRQGKHSPRRGPLFVGEGEPVRGNCQATLGYRRYMGATEATIF
jgi:hypothetical protein